MNVNARTRSLQKLSSFLKNLGKKKTSLIFFSDEKNITQDQKGNKQNDRWLCEDPNNVPVVMSTKFPKGDGHGVVSNEGDIMPPPTSSRGASE